MRGVKVANSNAWVYQCVGWTDGVRGNFVWVHLGAKLGFDDAVEEKRTFQTLLDGGVYIVRLNLLLIYRTGVKSAMP
jgi:hypothetical protein